MKQFVIYDSTNFDFDVEECFDDYQDTVDELDIKTDNKIIAIADLGLWNGRRSGYSMCGKNLSYCMTVGNADYNKVYFDGYNVRKKAIHHDGTNYILFREVKPNVDIDKFCDMLYNDEEVSMKTIQKYTKSLRKYVKRYYEGE